MGRKTSIALTALLVLSALAGVLPMGMGAAGTAAAADGPTVSTCDNYGQRALGAILGVTLNGALGLDERRVDPCINTNVNITDVDTKEEAMRRVAMLALEDRRYFESFETQWDEHTDRLKSPSWRAGKTAFIQAMKNGSSEVEGVTEARTAVHDRTANQQRELWVFYRSLQNSMATLASQAEDQQIRNESIRIGKINSSGQPEWGYKLTNSSDSVVYPTTTVTLSNGGNVVLPAPYKGNYSNISDRLNPLQDDVLVQVYDPESGEWENIINTASSTYSVGTTVDDPSSRTVDLTNMSKATFDVTAESGITAADEFPASLGSHSIMVDHMDGNGVYMHVKDGDGNSVVYLEALGSPPVTRTATVSYDSGNATITLGGESVTFSTSDTTLEIGDTSHVNVTNLEQWDSKSVSSYTNEFKQKHQKLETIDNNVVDGLGDSQSGYLNDVANNVDLGNINWSDAYTSYERYRMMAGNTSADMDSYMRAMYTDLGYGSPGTQAELEITIHDGATVNGATLDSNKTVEGMVYTSVAPPNESWSTGTTYNILDDMENATVYVTYQETTEYTENGTTYYEVNARDLSIESGDFTVNSITNSSGTTIETIGHEDYDPDSTNVSALTSQIDTLQNTVETLRDEMEEDQESAAGGGSGDDNVTFDFGGLFDWIPSIETPFSSIGINWPGLALIGGLGVIAIFNLPAIAAGAAKVASSLFGIDR